jgi:hypothetical protein
MKKNLLNQFVLLFFLTSINIFASSVNVDVKLSPAGSFSIDAGSVKGKIKKVKGELHAKKLSVRVKKFKTGLDLRDKHTKEKLQYKSKAGKKISLINVIGKNGKATGTLVILNKKHKITFLYKVKSGHVVGNFTLSLKKLGFKGISYLGVGVQDKVTVKFKKKI